jgi:hypothetical protein
MSKIADAKQTWKAALTIDGDVEVHLQILDYYTNGK